jgi:hypothetical protein
MSDDREQAFLQSYAGVYGLAKVSETNAIPPNHEQAGHLAALCQLLDRSERAALTLELKKSDFWYYLGGQLVFDGSSQVRVHAMVDTYDTGIDGTLYLGYGGDDDGLYFTARLTDATVEGHELTKAQLVLVVDGAPPELDGLRPVRECSFISQAAYRALQLAKAAPQVRQWTEALADTRLQKASGDWDRDNLSAGGYNEREDWRFFGDGTYSYHRRFVLSMDTYDVGAYNPSMRSSHTSEDRDAGSWQVQLSGNQAMLVLDSQDGNRNSYVLGSGTQGVLMLGKARYRWTKM